METESPWLSPPAERMQPAADVSPSAGALPSPTAVSAAVLPAPSGQGDTSAPQTHPYFAMFQGPAPDMKQTSTKTGQSTCRTCMINLKNARTITNRRYATYKKKKLKNQLPAPVRPQHRYNTRSKRPRPEQRGCDLQNGLTIDDPPAHVPPGSSTKRIRLLHPPKGNEIPGVNFPT